MEADQTAVLCQTDVSLPLDMSDDFSRAMLQLHITSDGCCTQSVQCQTLPSSADDIAIFSKLVADCMIKKGFSLPEDYILYSCKAMTQLSLSGRSNILYNLAKAIGTIRSDDIDSHFPCNRMPMGLLGRFFYT